MCAWWRVKFGAFRFIKTDWYFAMVVVVASNALAADVI